jgi:hypothetical protein
MSEIDLAALAADIRYLKDRTQIIDALNRYTRGLDRLDRALLLSAYHPHATDDRGAAYHPTGYQERGIFSGGREARVDWLIEEVGKLHHCSHHLSNFTIEIDGDQAHCEAYVLTTAMPTADAGVVTLGGARYNDRLERIDGRWAIAHREVIMDFQFTVPINDLPPGILTGRRDRNDRTYERPLSLSADALERMRSGGAASGN